jgi:hypothetical protein
MARIKKKTHEDIFGSIRRSESSRIIGLQLAVDHLSENVSILRDAYLECLKENDDLKSLLEGKSYVG